MENIIKHLFIGDQLYINDWENVFTVYGKSDNFVLAYCAESGEYTIIPRKPVDYFYNGIPVGSFVCSPDNLVFGYPDGYHFDDPEWINQYLLDLENGEIEISIRRREKINTLKVRRAKDGEVLCV
jgi:hypothetical protein